MKKILTAILAMATFAAFTACESDPFDATDLTGRIDNLEDRVETLEDAVKRINEDISALYEIVEAAETGLSIEKVTETSSGYTILLTNGKTIEIKHGNNGTNAPVIGTGKFEDVYYWTVSTGGNTEWLLDGDGKKIPVTGKDGAPGANPTVSLGVDAEGYWTVTIDGTATRVLDAGGNPIKAQGPQGDKGDAGDAFFKSVTQDESSVTFVLADGVTTITVPKKIELKLSVQHAGPNAKVMVKWGESRELNVEHTGSFDYMISKPDGWKVAFTGTKLRITAPAQANTYAEPEGVVSLLAITSTRANHEMAKINVVAGDRNEVIHTVTFEGDYWEPFVAANYAPAAKTTNAINGGDKYTYPIWVDAPTQLTTECPLVFSGKPEWSFGYDYPWIVSSYNSNDPATYGSYKTDLYVYNPTNANATAGGGRNGSNNFLIGYGYHEPGNQYTMGDTRPVFMFLDWKPRVIKSIWVNTTPYFLQEATVGSGLSNPIAQGQDVKIHATGIDENGAELGTVDLLFAWNDGTIHAIKEWTEWDLSALGPINALRLNMSGGPNNGYGFSLPAYYAVDDVTVVVE